MSEDYNYFEPKEFVSGTTVAWKKRVPDYLPADGWALKYSFRNSAGTGFDVTATADGSDYLITIPISTTGGLTAGVYYWQAWIEEAELDIPTTKVLIDSGQINLLKNLGALATSAAHDGRSEVKKILDAIDATIEGRATVDQQEYTIGNRQIKKIQITELIALRTEYAKLYAQEQRNERLKQGAPFFKNINTRFTRP